MHPTVSVSPSRGKESRKSGAREIALWVGVSWFAPLLVHTVPWSAAVELDERLLPLFWAAWTGAYLLGAAPGLLVALTSMVAVALVQGSMTSHSAALVSIELAVFVLVGRGLIRQAPGFWWSAPFALAAAQAAGVAAQAWLPGFGGVEQPVSLFLSGIQSGLPGILVLALLNLLLIKVRPQPDDWDAT